MNSHAPPPAVSAFDAAAATYDHSFTHTTLARWLREAVWAHLATTFVPGDHVLELGCGTGEDAIWLAGRGVRVTATDASPAMLEIARRKVEAAGVTARVNVRPLALSSGPLTIDDWPLTIDSLPFDGAFSNFGALNCLADRRGVALALARWVKPGGRVVLVVMGPVCPWEIAWHLGHGQVRQAFRRWQAGAPAHVGDGVSVPVWYPSPRRLRREFGEAGSGGFRPRRLVGIGTLLPPSYLGHLVDRWPGLFRSLTSLEARLGHRLPWTWLNDHYLMVLERV